jgi:hypothetical protein
MRQRFNIALADGMLAGKMVHASVTLALTAIAFTQPHGRLEGRVVVHGREHQPVFDAMVTLSAADGSRPPRTAATDESGRFVFEDIADGLYEVTATKRAFLRSPYGARRPEGAGTPLEIEGGRPLSGVVVTLWPAAVITGIVLDPGGHPLADAPVSALQSVAARSGQRTLATVSGRAVTDDRGVYRIFGLAPGQYAIAVLPPPKMRASTAQRTLTAVYYPGTVDPSAAVAVSVQAGEEKDAVDVQMQLVPSVTITAMVQPPSAVELAQLSLTATVVTHSTIAALAIRRPAGVAGDGTMMASGVPPGRYVISVSGITRDRARPDAPIATWWGRAEGIAGGDDRTALTVILRPASVVSGTVRTDTTIPLPAGRAVEVRLVSDPSEPVAYSAAVAAGRDGTFRFTAVPPGRFSLSARAAGVADVTDRVLEVAPDQMIGDVIIRVTDRLATVAGMVVDTAGQPQADVAVVLFPADKRYWRDRSPRIRELRTSAKGAFVAAGLPPGDYLIATSEDSDLLDAAMLERLSAGTDLSRLVLDEPRVYRHTVVR